MDVKNVSEVREFQAMLKNIRAMAEKAAKRKGERVKYHPPPTELINKHMLSAFSLNLRLHDDEKHYIHTSQVPPPYPPCTLPLSELEDMSILDMRLETHHRGKKIQLRVLTPAHRMTAIMAIVEDKNNTAVLFQIYQQPDEHLVSIEEILEPDSVCIVKEPFFKTTQDGSYSIRVDHVSDIIWLPSDDDRILTEWKGGIPKILTSLPDNSSDIRAFGNSLVQHERWAAAMKVYSMAIDASTASEETELAYLNRSLTNLKLGNLEASLADAIKGTNSDNPSEKGLFRQARALYALCDFEACLKKLKLLKKLHQDSKVVGPEIERVQVRLSEQQNASYNFPQMYRQAKNTPPLIDCATYSAPVEIRESPGRGNGLYTTRAVSAGELVLCEKAFAYEYAGDDNPKAKSTILMNLSTESMTAGGHANLITQIVQMAYHNPKLRSSIYDLHHGDYKPVQGTQADGVPIVDTFQIERIIALNSFGAPRTSRESFARWVTEASASQADNEKQSAFTTTGIWLIASRINHACVGNVRRSFIGDMQIVRATRDLEAGTEVGFPYQAPPTRYSAGDVQKNLRHWGFVCKCDLCVAGEATSGKLRIRRQESLKLLKSCFRNGKFTNLSRAVSLIDQIESAYEIPAAKAVRLELLDPCLGLGVAMIKAGRVPDGIGMVLRALDAVGFDIIAHPPNGNEDKPQFKIVSWGMVNELVPSAFLHLYHGYKMIAPELCVEVRECFKTIYAMVVGEKETALDQFPKILG